MTSIEPPSADPGRLRVLTLNIQVGMQTAHYGDYVTGAWRHVLPSRRVRANLDRIAERSEEHTSELQSLMRISYAVFCLKKTHTTLRTSKRYIQTKPTIK